MENWAKLGMTYQYTVKKSMEIKAGDKFLIGGAQHELTRGNILGVDVYEFWYLKKYPPNHKIRLVEIAPECLDEFSQWLEEIGAKKIE